MVESVGDVVEGEIIMMLFGMFICLSEVMVLFEYMLFMMFLMFFVVISCFMVVIEVVVLM